MIVPRDEGRTDSELRHAIITITSRDLCEAITIREMARQTVVTVPHWLDSRGFRMASTRWMQPRGATERKHAWRPQPQAWHARLACSPRGGPKKEPHRPWTEVARQAAMTRKHLRIVTSCSRLRQEVSSLSVPLTRAKHLP